MTSAKFFKEFTKQFSETLPPPLKELQSAFEQQFYRGLELAFSKLDLVTREEFDTQTALLAATQDKVTQLETRISELESELGDKK